MSNKNLKLIGQNKFGSQWSTQSQWFDENESILLQMLKFPKIESENFNICTNQKLPILNDEESLQQKWYLRLYLL